MLTDPPQRIVSVSCRGITHNTLDLTWSEPLRSYDEEVFVGYMVRGRCSLFFRYTSAVFRAYLRVSCLIFWLVASVHTPY